MPSVSFFAIVFLNIAALNISIDGYSQVPSVPVRFIEEDIRIEVGEFPEFSSDVPRHRECEEHPLVAGQLPTSPI